LRDRHPFDVKRGLGVPLEETMEVPGADHTGYHPEIGQIVQIPTAEEFPQRLEAVLAVVYLVFNER